MKRYFIIGIFALLSACGTAKSDIVAKVDGIVITKTEFTSAFKFELTLYNPKILDDQDRITAIKNAVLDDIIQNIILYKKAKESGIVATDEELAQEYNSFKSRYTEASFQKMLELKGISYEDWKKDKMRSLLADKLIMQEVVSKIDITDSDIQKYYQKHKKQFTHGDEIHARQILVDDKKLAEELRERILKGENFAAIAQEFSIAPEGKRGGDLGWFQRSIMPKAFDEACFPLPTGEISPVVRTEFGYHIFKVIERRPPKTVPLSDVKDKITALIQQDRMGDAFNKWFKPIKDSADIEINQEVLKEIK